MVKVMGKVKLIVVKGLVFNKFIKKVLISLKFIIIIIFSIMGMVICFNVVFIFFFNKLEVCCLVLFFII